MTYNDIKELIGIINDSKITNFELITDSINIKMNKNNKDFEENSNIFSESLKQSNLSSTLQSTNETNIIEKTNKILEETKNEELSNKNIIKGNIIKSPIVGTFYASTSPGKPPIVSKGDKVSKGDVLCIVEAMKVMNEIVSEFDGEIEEIFVENGQLVEYGESLFSII